jgi:hypothetical protein
MVIIIKWLKQLMCMIYTKVDWNGSKQIKNKKKNETITFF